jgi:hypothetical protein
MTNGARLSARLSVRLAWQREEAVAKMEEEASVAGQEATTGVETTSALPDTEVATAEVLPGKEASETTTENAASDVE